MSEWTPSAQAELDRYLARVRAGAQNEGADAGEVAEDLRRHVQEEAAASGLSIVTEEDVRRITARLGVPEPPSPQTPADASPAASDTNSAAAPDQKGWRMGFLLFFSVLLPAITLVIEWATGMCAAAFFDPIPTLWHVLVAALVPAVNLGAWWTLRTGKPGGRPLLGWLNGAVLGLTAFYVLLFLPLTPFAFIAIVFYGFGLLPSAPLLALLGSIFLRLRLRRLGAPAAVPLPGLWRGLALGLLAILALNAQVWLTRLGMQWGASDDPATEQRGVRWLRQIGHEETLRRACYGRTTGAANMDVVEWVVSNGKPLSAQQARMLYYRVTGHGFNTVPAPPVRTGRGAFADLEEWTWDNDQGGEKVGGRIKGLGLHSSRLDAAIEPNPALAYCEWTLEFKNDAPRDQEARAQIQLPPGGVVSRLTLWVNGEEREAAFAGRAQVRQAYQKVAIRQRRDPVLVNTCGPDRVLVQCFPVPRNGGIMKIRLGITAPLMLDEAGLGLWQWPAFIERNFSIREPLRHSVWMKSSRLLTPSSAHFKPGSATNSLQGQLPEGELGTPRSLVRVQRNRDAGLAWSQDDRAVNPAIIRQSITAKPAPKPSRAIVVLDPSTAMEASLDELAKVLSELPAALEWGVVAAGDDPVWLGKPGDNREWRKRLREHLRGLRRQGGYDNLPALLAAWDEAAGREDAVVVWIHGPQPIELSSVEPLCQRLERAGGGTQILSFEAVPGPNRILEKLDTFVAIRSVPGWPPLAKTPDGCSPPGISREATGSAPGR